MKITVGQLAALVNGRVEGDANSEITGFAPISEAAHGAVTFLTNPKYSHYLYESDATAVLVNDDFVPEGKVKPALIFVKDAYTTVSQLLEQFNSGKQEKTGVEQPSFIGTAATTGHTRQEVSRSPTQTGEQTGRPTLFPGTFLSGSAL